LKLSVSGSAWNSDVDCGELETTLAKQLHASKGRGVFEGSAT